MEDTLDSIVESAFSHDWLLAALAAAIVVIVVVLVVRAWFRRDELSGEPPDRADPTTDLSTPAPAPLMAPPQPVVTLERGTPTIDLTAVAHHYGVMPPAVERLRKALDHAAVPLEDWDSVLRRCLTVYRQIGDAIGTVAPDGSSAATLKSRAAEALAAGATERVETLLNQASDDDAATAKAAEDDPKFMLRAAASKSHLGALMQALLRHDLAARYYDEAARMAETASEEATANYLQQRGRCASRAADYGSAAEALARAAELYERVYGADHLEVGATLAALAAAHRGLGDLDTALSVLQRAVAIGELTLGADHPDVIGRLTELADLYEARGQLDEAETVYKRVIAAGQKTLGGDSPTNAVRLSHLAALYGTQGRFAEAEELFRQALQIDETVLGPGHHAVAIDLANLSVVLRTGGKHGEAEKVYKRALDALERTLGPDHPNVASILTDYAVLLRETDRTAEADEAEALAAAIRSHRAAAGQSS